MPKFLEVKNTSFGDSINDFIYSFPGTAHLKDIKSFKYLSSNSNDLDTYNFKSEKELLGQTVFELEQIMENKWPTDFAKQVYKTDAHVIESGKPLVMNNIILLTGPGYVSVRKLMKSPIFSFEGTITSILTLGVDFTKSIKTQTLWKIYKNFYKSNPIVSIRFMEYIGLKDWFTQPLTIREIDCLVSIIQFHTMKNVANALNISQRTVECHIENIKSKIKCGNLQKTIEKIIITSDGFSFDGFDL